MTSAQNKDSEIYSAIETIENYFNGYVERDIDLLNAAFDTVNGIMKIPSKTSEGLESYENHYFKDIVLNWASKDKLSDEIKDNCALSILNIDIEEGKMGMAKIKMKIGEVSYIDNLTLQKINKVWKITNKAYLVVSE